MALPEINQTQKTPKSVQDLAGHPANTHSLKPKCVLGLQAERRISKKDRIGRYPKTHSSQSERNERQASTQEEKFGSLDK